MHQLVKAALFFSCAMSPILLAAVAPGPAIAAASQKAEANPLLSEWVTPDGVPPYDLIRPEHYEPAFEVALAEARADYGRIAGDAAAPSFANTIEAMERARRPLARISATFFNVASADATDTIQAIEEAVSPKLTRLQNDIYLDQTLFSRVDRLWKDRDKLSLTPEQARLLEETHRDFVRAGAALDPVVRARVAAINEELSKLGVAFGQKLLADQKVSAVYLSAAEVEGLPADQRAAAAAAAKAAGREGLHPDDRWRGEVVERWTRHPWVNERP